MSDDARGRRRTVRSPIATPGEVAAEPAPFPAKSREAPVEAFFADWRERLTRNLSRRSTGRWEPLTWVHAAERTHTARVADDALVTPVKSKQ